VVRLEDGPIRVDELMGAVRSAGDGAVALFVGTVRDSNRGRVVSDLEYQAYPAMAAAQMARIEQETLERFAVSSVAVVHRIGRLAVGDIAVCVAVAAPHRDEAFTACRQVIERLKSEVPIWKKETFEGGAVWIEGPGETPADDQEKSSRSRSSSSIPK